MIRRVLVALVLCLAASANAAVTIDLEETAVNAEGLTPGGAVAVFGVWQEKAGYHLRHYAHDEIMTADSRGEIRLTLARPLSLRSAWAVVDLATGEHALRGADENQVRPMDLPGGPGTGPGGLLNRIVQRADFIEALLVRPGAGAWRFTAGDGGSNDDDRTPDGVIAFATDRMTPVGASGAPPGHVLPGDVVILVDTSRMRWAALRAGR